MRLWLLVIGALVVQEFTSTTAALAAAAQQGLNLWIVHAIWAGATILEIYIGFVVGKWIRKRYAHSRPGRWAEKIARKAEGMLGRWGKNGFVFLIAFVAFPWMASFVAAWIDMPAANMLVFSFFGEFVWYLFEWATAFGVLAISHNLTVTVAIVVVIGVGITILMNAITRKSGIMK